MLDLLLQRADDLRLWRDADIRYVVVDEFHTYDGAQGTDVAMLLRRLAAATGHAEPGRPLGRICPVATSATLGETAGSTEAIRKVAEQVFGTPFPESSVIGEQRQAPRDFLGLVDYGLPMPDPTDLAALPDPRLEPTAMEQAAELVTGQVGRTAEELGQVLRRHILTHALIEVLGDKPSTSPEILEDLPRKGPYSWGAVDRARSGRPPVPARRDPPVDQAAEPHRAADQRPPGVRLVRGGPPRGRIHPRRHAARVAARHLLPALRPVRLDRHLAGKRATGPGQRSAENLPGRRLRQAPRAGLHRRHTAGSQCVRGRPAWSPGSPGPRTRRSPRPPAQPGPRHRYRRGG